MKSYGNDWIIDLSSSSSITVECEKIFSKIFFFISSNLSQTDTPGPPELVLEGEALKGEELQLTCFLEERGNPGADHFVWTK